MLQELIKSLYHKVEGLAFDAVMYVSIPALIWWTNYGLRREDLSEEVREFWESYRYED